MRIEALENLAKLYVGDPKSPLSFVTVDGVVTAVFVNDTKAAIEYASTFQEHIPVSVEGSTGVVWDNPEALRLHNPEEYPDE